MKNTNYCSSHYTLLLLKITWISILLFFSGLAKGAGGVVLLTDSQITERSYKVLADAMVDIDLMEATINTSTWNENKVSVKVTLIVKAWDEEALKQALAEIPVDLSGNEKKVNVSVGYCKNVKTNGGITKIKTNKGKIKISQLRIVCDVKMPKSNSIRVDNRFGNVNLAAHEGNVDLDLYECKLDASQIVGKKGMISLKFCKGQMGDLKDASIKIYETQLQLGTFDSLQINSKFSSVQMKNSQYMDWDSYEDLIEFKCANDLVGSFHYTKLQFECLDNFKVKTYEAKISADRIKEKAVLSSKFSKYSISEIKSLQMISSYEDDFNLQRVSDLNINAKFTNLTVNQLSKSLKIKAYEGNCQIGEVSDAFERIDISAKFYNVSLELSDKAAFQINSELDFGKLSFPENLFEPGERTKTDMKQIIKTRTKGYKGTKTIRVDGYETNVAVQ